METLKRRIETHMVQFGVRYKLSERIAKVSRTIVEMPKSQSRVLFDRAGVVKAGSAMGRRGAILAMQKAGEFGGRLFHSISGVLADAPSSVRALRNRYLRTAREACLGLLFHDQMHPVKRSMLIQLVEELLREGSEQLGPIHDYMTVCAEAARETDILLSEDDLLGIFLSASGPTLIKILQLLANDPQRPKTDPAREDRIATISSRAFTETPAMSNEDILRITKHIPGLRDRITKLDGKALGVASIGQVNLMIDRDGTQRVIKMIRPLAAYAFPMEASMLVTRLLPTGSTSSMSDLLVNFATGILSEFDLGAEAAWSTKLAKDYEELSKGRIRCAKTVFYGGPNAWQCTIQDLAPGKTLKKLISSEPSDATIKKVAPLLEDLADVWSQVALQGSHAFHADLHPGNVYVSDDLEYLTIIDFGACEQLDHSTHCYSLRLIMRFLLQKLYPTQGGADKLADALGAMCTLTGSDLKTVHSLVSETFQTLGRSTILSSLIQDIFSKVPNMGSCSRMTILQYVRGTDLLDGTISLFGGRPIEQVIVNRSVSHYRFAVFAAAYRSLSLECDNVAEAFFSVSKGIKAFKRLRGV